MSEALREPIQQTLVIPTDHPAFPGHFPAQPILPGAALVDLVVVALEAALGRPAGALQLISAKFLLPLGPGHVVQLAAEANAAGRWNCLLTDNHGAKVAQFVIQPELP